MKQKFTLIAIVLVLLFSAVVARYEREPELTILQRSCKPDRLERYGFTLADRFHHSVLAGRPYVDVQLPQGESTPKLKVSVDGARVSTLLTNTTENPIEYFYTTKPFHIWLEVIDRDGRPLSQYGEAGSTRWSSISVQNDRLRLPVDLRTLNPSETSASSVELREFFFRGDFDTDAPGLQVRAIARAYLDSSLDMFVESTSDWCDLSTAYP